MTTTTAVRPQDAFATFGLGKDILRAISEAGFSEPRPIQAGTIPPALEGRDILGLAQTGTGKTAAFVLPILEYLAGKRSQSPRALILAPTRELANQIHQDIQRLGRYTGLKSATIYGGVSAASQVRAIRTRPDILVACPGRLLDLMGSGAVRLHGIEIVVLDEADHMLDMGFLPDIRRVLSQLPPERQNLLFSATMPKEIRSLTDEVLKDPHVVELAHSAPPLLVEHAAYPVQDQKKAALLRHLLETDEVTSAIIFTRTKHRARRLAVDLSGSGHRAVALQGNMSQSQREKAMAGFRSGAFDLLVATDIAARGIDVARVSHVINFDFPDTTDAYTHRIGRTGRAERRGKACSFVGHDDFQNLKLTEKVLGIQIPRVNLPGFAAAGSGGSEAPVREDRPTQNPRGTGRPAGGGRGRGNGGPARSPSRETHFAGPGAPAAPDATRRGPASPRSGGAGPQQREASRGSSNRSHPPARGSRGPARGPSRGSGRGPAPASGGQRRRNGRSRPAR